MGKKSENFTQTKKYPPLRVSRSSSIDSKQCVDDVDLPLSKLVKNQINDSSHFNEYDQGQRPSAIKRNENHAMRKVNAKVSYEVMAGFRYNSKVLFCPEEQQFYVGNSASELGLAYTCYVRECRCRVQIRDNECFIGNAMAHNHEKKTGMYHNLCALNEIKSVLHSANNQFSSRQVFDDVIKR